ncbi:MFS general substrate transporter [Polyplosphaeria fusca]|uniref:MFS general substrate transporter n=1 Tax=Polyplosphaeria fusca TaxID=682080 RepID=A0A9P4R646_9PLEO|nr:MFS general substrate transporter [Polyplosphaeria fusca]
MPVVTGSTIPTDGITSTPLNVELSTITDTTTVPKTDDPYLVAFNPQFDSDNPLDWPRSRKWAVTDVLAATGFNRIMVSTIMAPALSTIAKEFNMNSTEAAMALSIYLLATAFGPLVIGPLSEVYGRKKVLHASNVWFLVWNIACGFASSKQLLIGARFLAGFGASSIYALSGGVLGDVWRPEQRGQSLGMYLLIPVLGAAVGPIIGGFMAGRTTWRWIFWSTSIFQGVMILVSFLTFHESYAPLILRRRAEKLRKDTGDARYYTLSESIVARRSVPYRLSQALSRPLRLLFFHPIIQIMSLISAFEYGILYIVLSSFAELWTKQYHVSVELSGLHYIALALGEAVGSQVGGYVMDAYYRRNAAKHPDDLDPEYRIPLTFPFAAVLPVGLFIYGWAAQYTVHWIAVDIGVFIFAFADQMLGMPLQAYVMESYSEHTSSALAASQFLRSMSAFLFPLFTPAMYDKMGYGWGNTMLGFACLLVGLPAPALLMVFGKRLRAKANTSW